MRADRSARARRARSAHAGAAMALRTRRLLGPSGHSRGDGMESPCTGFPCTGSHPLLHPRPSVTDPPEVWPDRTPAYPVASSVRYAVRGLMRGATHATARDFGNGSPRYPAPPPASPAQVEPPGLASHSERRRCARVPSVAAAPRHQSQADPAGRPQSTICVAECPRSPPAQQHQPSITQGPSLTRSTA